jgi:hypothetical protein
MAMRTAIHGALARLRKWWLEILAAAALGLIASAPTHGAAFLAGFMATFLILGWLMCLRHRRMPMHEKIDRISEGITEILDDVRGDGSTADDEEAPGRPDLKLVR